LASFNVLPFTLNATLPELISDNISPSNRILAVILAVWPIVNVVVSMINSYFGVLFAIVFV